MEGAGAHTHCVIVKAPGAALQDTPVYCLLPTADCLLPTSLPPSLPTSLPPYLPPYLAPYIPPYLIPYLSYSPTSLLSDTLPYLPIPLALPYLPYAYLSQSIVSTSGTTSWPPSCLPPTLPYLLLGYPPYSSNKLLSTNEVLDTWQESLGYRVITVHHILLFTSFKCNT